jgi:hypothetical protein
MQDAEDERPSTSSAAGSPHDVVAGLGADIVLYTNN